MPIDDCCGEGGPAWPGPAPTVWPATDYTGTTSPLPDVETPSMQWEGIEDASTILAGEPAFTPPDNPALVTLVEVRNQLARLHHGFPQGCFDTPANCHQAFNLEVIENWRYHAKMLELSYLDNPLAGKYLQTFCPCLTAGVWTPNDDTNTPGTMLAYTPEWTLVYISGTTSNWQKVWQGCTSVAGPIFGDGFGTVNFWDTQWRRIVQRINNQLIPARNKWFIAGHSYGAALACILAAVVKRADPTRTVNLFTAGCPSPGDQRLHDLLEPVNQVHLQNVGDPVCSMPPAGLTFWNIFASCNLLLRLPWQAWVPNRGRVNLSQTGERTAVNEGAVEFNTLLSVVNALSPIEIPAADYPAHAASVYYARASIVQ